MSLRWWIVGGIVVAASLVALHLHFPALHLGGLPWIIAAPDASILLVVVYIWIKDDIRTDTAIDLELGGIGYVAGLKLLVVSSGVLISIEIAAPPFESEDLCLIAAWGFTSNAIRNAWS